ncbi:Protein of unknown function (DUF1674), putative [Trypanosoma equiperdum]|uniref:Succinate dehydrogenase assembly factor 4, mitochondrial n=4 Tax=Trypanozoon TaxID=39700 RepID=Q580H4_TRYB2|nr:hypothetical protein, conserved [Trypanosoma brucei gambiense DAL972]XP_846983.1 hypothetical protein, conserved [Trypanosoma brucei brucei TREU927]AAX79786.1 hypothetical protein, conserved [Trypanosoma brucei]RHW71111.1 hypothetical protein DPX39_080015200 [Trypanosoma brucei equiperdum]SCU65212.1 Protein of unknown function (DUF1674), putative [Trypanosoma equiperdum]AAZ12917.1 hypothetical protein, conserved [Trypanosoma brucei brucei TREU927]CBH13156.1 hypothetical protein, conserved |eukprot:XP_011775433.1 hypothetical protein, conserved [Trypanosoma brucei gambiense DAL972]
MRRSFSRLIGADGGIFMSAVHDKQYLQHRLATLGKAEQQQPLSEETIQRLTTSTGSAESLFNKAAGAQPTNIVDEATGVPVGSVQLDPVRYGDWESNGRCHDF